METIKQLVKTGYGLGLLSLTEAKKMVLMVKRKLHLNDEESLKLAQKLVANSEKASKEILGTASRYFESALIKSGAASKGELKTAKKFLKKRTRRVKDTLKENVKKRFHQLKKKR